MMTAQHRRGLLFHREALRHLSARERSPAAPIFVEFVSAIPTESNWASMTWPVPIWRLLAPRGSALPIKQLVKAGQRRLPPKPIGRIWRRRRKMLKALRLRDRVLSCSPFQAAGTETACLSSKLFSMAATEQGRGHDHETTVDHALMRGLVTAGPVMRRGASSV